MKTLYRFNIYPEFVLGLVHRLVTVFVAVEPYTLFMFAIFALAGVQVGALFVLGGIVSKSCVAVSPYCSLWHGQHLSHGA